MWLESRMALEMAALCRDEVLWGRGIPAGFGEPVLLIPGYLAGDVTLSTMAGWLTRIGYRAARAGMRVNAGCTATSLEALEDRLERAVDRVGVRGAIVGHSRGGCLARILAVRRPDLVRGIITLGSPLVDPMAIHPIVRANVRLVGMLGTLGVPRVLCTGCLTGPCCAEAREDAVAAYPDGVGFVSIYSRSDGVVRWQACCAPEAELVEVRASHLGMAAHGAVYRAIGDALAAFPGGTKPALSVPAITHAA